MEPEAYVEMAALEESHWWYAGMRTITGVLLDQELSPGNAFLILDAGCGTGANLGALTRYGKAWGMDYSPLALDFTAKKHPNRLSRGSVDALTYPANCFDLVTCFDVIVCQEVPDDGGAIKELARVARPGGLVLIRVAALNALRGPHDIVVHGVRRYTAHELRRKVEEAGLEVQRITYANTFLLPLVFLSRTLQNFQVRMGSEPASDVDDTPALVNSLLAGVFRLEAALIRLGLRLPLGVSLIILARKPAAEGLIS